MRTQDISDVRHRTPFNKDKEYYILYRRRGTENIFLHTVEYNLKPDSNTVLVHQNENNQRRHFDFDVEFQKQWKAKSADFPNFSVSTINEKAKEVFLKLLSLNIRNIKFTLTSDESIFFQGNVEKKNIYIEVFFDIETTNHIDVVLNIYNEKGEAEGFHGSIDGMIGEIESNIKEYREHSLIAPTKLPYGLPEELTATTSF